MIFLILQFNQSIFKVACSKNSIQNCLHLTCIWGVASLVFVLFSILPGDPSRMMMGQRENEEMRLAIQQKYGFDQPIRKQYLYYLNDLSPVSFHSNNTNDFTNTNNHMYSIFASFFISESVLVLKVPYLRSSFVRKDISVQALFLTRYQIHLYLHLLLYLLPCFLAFSWCLQCNQQHKFIDQLLSVISVLGMALPSFFSAIIIAWLFGFIWEKHTGLSMTGSLFEVDDYGRGEYICLEEFNSPSHYIGNKTYSCCYSTNT